MASIISPNMNLIIPTVGSEPGPTYAFDVNTSLTLIDQHDHTPGKGVAIVTAALNIDADLSLNDFSLINALTLVFTASSSASTTPNSLSVAPGGESPQQQDLWYTPNTGVPIQITKNGIVNTVASSIPGESYAAGTFFWTQEQDALPTTPANFDIGSITLRPNVALTAFGVTLSPASAISSQYQINLPLIPVSKKILTLDTSGNMVADTDVDNSSLEIVSNNIRVKAQGITAAMVLNNTLTTNQISLTAGITQGQLAADALAWRIKDFTSLSTPSFNVRVATTANGVMSTAFDNGSTVDGVVLATNDLILIKNQTVTTDNGVYVVQASGIPLRSTSYDTFTELNGAGVHVTAGSANTNTNWWQNNLLTSLASPQSWSISSTELFTVPTGVSTIAIVGAGGGGGGGGGGAVTGGAAGGGGGGGGGGAPVYQLFQQVTPGDILAVTIGVGGTGGAAASTGSNGVSSSIAGASFILTLLAGGGGGFGGVGAGVSSLPGGNGNQIYSAWGVGSDISGSGGGGGGGGSGKGPGGDGAELSLSANYGSDGGGGGGLTGVNGTLKAGNGGSSVFAQGGIGATVTNISAGGGGGASLLAGGDGAASNATAGVSAAANSGAGGGGGAGRRSTIAAGGIGGNGGSGRVVFYYLKGGA